MQFSYFSCSSWLNTRLNVKTLFSVPQTCYMCRVSVISVKPILPLYGKYNVSSYSTNTIIKICPKVNILLYNCLNSHLVLQINRGQKSARNESLCDAREIRAPTDSLSVPSSLDLRNPENLKQFPNIHGVILRK